MRMRKFKQEKLWRDKVIKKCEDEGSILHIKKPDDQEFDGMLREKLLEEAQEVVSASNQKHLIEELADLYEVIDTIIELHHLSKEEILAAQERKHAERGGFAGRSYVTVAEHPEGSAMEHYCLDAPDKYPEIIVGE